MIAGTEKIICSGFGGQGIMVMGKFLSYVALEAGKFTTYLPAYGAEVRGGTAHCMVTISDSEIYSPYIDEADAVIVMNEPSVRKFENRIKKEGVLIINKSLVSVKSRRDDLKIIEVPFTEIATRLGNIKCANTVALGTYLSAKSIAPKKTIDAVLSKMLAGLRPEIFEVNREAIKEGFSYGKS